MPQDPWIWIAFGVALALVVVVAMWKGFNVRLGKGDLTASFERPAQKAPADRAVTSVARDLTLDEAEVGNVTGRRVGSTAASSSSAAAAGTSERSVDVMSGAKVSKSRLGDITGEEIGER